MTIKDIARLAGCGVSTVSRALNGSSEISDATRARINEVIQKYNYTPNGNARRMRQTAPNSVLLIVNGSSNLFSRRLSSRYRPQRKVRDYSL